MTTERMHPTGEARSVDGGITAPDDCAPAIERPAADTPAVRHVGMSAPDDGPDLTPDAARTLLRILLTARDRQR
jgi:hypothetical protein